MARKALTHEEHRIATRALLQALDDFFHPPGQSQKYGIMVFAHDRKQGKTNYFASIDRESGAKMIEELLTGWKQHEGGKQ